MPVPRPVTPRRGEGPVRVLRVPGLRVLVSEVHS